MNFYNDRVNSIKNFLNSIGMEKEINIPQTGFYLCYPDFFYSAIQNKKIDYDDETMTKLCLSSYLIYKSIIEFDDYLDQDESILTNSSLLLTKYNIGLRLLSNIFDFNSVFWSEWELRQQNFFQTMEFEREIKNKSKLSVFYKEEKSDVFFTKFYDNKSSFSFLAIVGVSALSKDEIKGKTIKDLMQIQSLFNFAFSLMDDVEDFRKDINGLQINYAHYKYIKSLRINEKWCVTNLNKEVESFYKSDIPNSIMTKALNKLNEAIEIAEKIKHSESIQWLLNLKRNDIKSKMKIIKEYTV